MISIEAQNAIQLMKANREDNFQYALVESLVNQRSEWEKTAQEYRLPKELDSKEMKFGEVTGELIFLKGVVIKPNEKIILHFHGGGLNQGSALTHRKLGGLIVLETKIPLFIHNYGLAPEHPFPIAIIDSVKVYKKLLSDGYSAENIIFGGDSSGAGLMCSTLLFLKKEKLKLPKAMYLLCPQLDNTFRGATMETNKENDHRVCLEDLLICANHYRGNEPANNPLISPIYADLTSFPSTFIQAGGAEILLDDAVRFEKNLKECGVEVSIDIWEDMWHVFQSGGDKIPESKRALENLHTFLNEHLG